MKLTLEQFTYGMTLLSAVHGDNHAVFINSHIAQVWFNFFAARCSNEKYIKMIEYYLAMAHWFPKVPNHIYKLWEESGEEHNYNQNYRLQQQEQLLALPSQEHHQKQEEAEYIKNLSQSQMEENRRRLAIVQKIAKDLAGEDRQDKITHLTTVPMHELEAIASTVKKAKQLSVKGDMWGNLKVSPNALFEDMKKYFDSGSEKYRQVAIDWASDPANGCELVKDCGRVVDIRQIDF